MTRAAGNPDAFVADLKARWPKLHDLDRAKRIQNIQATGMSTRTLATALGRPESSLRYILKAAEAPLLDRIRARKGKISTRELSRRSEKAGLQRKAQEREALDLERTKEAQKGAAIIAEWLREMDLSSAHGEAIIDEARRLLVVATRAGSLPKCALSVPGTPIQTIIETLRPPRTINPDIKSVSWYADWLARWAFFAFPDELVRHKALNIALDAEIKAE